MTNPVIGHITLGVIDYQRSIAFFRDVIGFPLHIFYLDHLETEQ